MKYTRFLHHSCIIEYIHTEDYLSEKSVSANGVYMCGPLICIILDHAYSDIH